MAKELIARGQATVYTQTDAYTINQSLSEYVFAAANTGTIVSAVTFTSTLKVTLGGVNVTDFTIGTITKPAGFSTITVNNTNKTIAYSVAANTTSLADTGIITIPVVIKGETYSVSFVWSKAKTGATGPAGADANLLDWVSDWDTGKTLIGGNSVITPKIFAGVKNANGTLTGVALGHFALSALNASGQVVTETIDGIYGFKDGNRTFFVDNGGNAQLGRGTQYIKYNATTGKVEFGSEVALAWIGSTYIDATGIFTGTLSANTVGAVNINATQITAGTIAAARIDVAALKASLITAANIEALTLNVTKGKIGGWTIDSDSIFLGTKNNTSGAYTSASASMTIGSTGIRGFKWRLDATGAGAVAGGNISWDAAGNVTFGNLVVLNWSTPIKEIVAGLGGATYPKLTQITNAGIYTGTLSAYQITAGIINTDLLAAGSIKAEKLEAASIRANIINADYISGLTCSFIRGKIGGWNIKTDSITTDNLGIVGAIPLQIRSSSAGSGYWYNCGYRPYGLTMTWHQSNNAGHFVMGEIAASGNTVKTGFIGIQMMAWDNTEYFCLSANYTLSGSKEVYNRIAGWAFDNSRIWKNNVSLGADGSIANGTKWQLNNDGSGRVASGNITWDASGNVSFASSVSLNWTTPVNNITTALGGSSYPKLTQISSTGIYTGTLTAAQVNAVAINAGSITTGTLSADRIAAGSITAAKLDAASIKSSIINTDYINGLSCTFTQGKIGGWTINSGSLSNTHIALDNANKRVVVYGANAGPTSGQRSQLYYNSDGDFGFLATNASGSGIACFGAANYIAGWTVDTDSIFRGTKANTSGAYTSGSGAVTIGSNGLRGYKWQLESTGAGAVAGGNISWDTSGNVTFGSAVSLNWTGGIDAAKELACAMAFGRMLYRDPTFYNGNNSINIYNNLGNGTVTITRTGDSNAPNDSKVVLVIQNRGEASPYCGGFNFGTSTAYRKVFITRIIAKIPTGR
ncbi:beta strand repeat-containing protein, partial [Viscerimonas tarda]